MSNYSELLKDPRWQKNRLLIFERDGWRCVCCSKTEKTLHVHHIEYKRGRAPWEYPLDNFITLCEDCHEHETLIKNVDLHAVLRMYNIHAKIPMFALRKWLHTVSFLYLHDRDTYNKIKDIFLDYRRSHEDQFVEFFHNTIGAEENNG